MGISRSTTARAPRQPANPLFSQNSDEAPRARQFTVPFDQLVDGLNRLPRPALMVLTVALFAYAIVDPSGFAARMEAINGIPEPLWWMQGAVITFYFGAREAHYHRQGKTPANPAAAPPTPTK